jgi:inosine-uridine nucleoside N-ribohydrolase
MIGKQLVPVVLSVSLGAIGCSGDPTAGETAAASSEACSSRRVPSVVFDTDMDFDDAAALAYLCAEHQRGNIELRAVTVENDGAGLPGSAIRHARCILAACGAPDVPVADGSPVGMHAVSPELRGAVEAVLQGAFASCSESTAPSSISAPDLLARTIHDRDTTLIATGPLTNVATAIASHRSMDHIERVVLMSGAVDVPGSLLGTGTEPYDQTQELNAWADPAALDAVLDRFGMRVTLVPLDATNDVLVTPAYVGTIANAASTPSADIVVDITSQPIVQFGISIHAFFWWDPLAAVTAVSGVGREVVTTDEDRIAVVTAEGPSSGRTYRSRHGHRIHVAYAADDAVFESAFLAGLNETD